LTLNGSRPTAILESKKPPVTAQSERKNTVFSIAEILYVPVTLGNEDSRAMEMDKRASKMAQEIEDILNDLRKPNSPAQHEGQFRIHRDAGLLIFTGTAEETELVHSTLEALKQNALVQKGTPEEQQIKQLSDILQQVQEEDKQPAKTGAAGTAAADSKSKPPENLKK
jgi:hypothetical protein